MSEAPPTVRRAAALFAFAVVFALASFVLELVSYRLGATSFVPILDARVVTAGAALRIPLAALGGIVIAAPFASLVASGRRRGVSIVPSALAAGLVLVASAAAWFHLGAVGTLPSLSAVRPGALAESKPALLVAVAFALALPFVVLRVLDAAGARVAKPGSLAADAIVVILAAIIGVAAIGLGSPALMYGATPPLLQFVVALSPSAPPPEEPSEGGHDHAHAHHDHDGGAHTHAPVAPTFPSDPPPSDGVLRPGPEIRYLMSRAQGIEALPVEVDPSYPFCRTATEGDVPQSSRSVIVVALEGIGMRERRASDVGGPYMPELARIAERGIELEHVLSVSDDAAQGLVSALSGVTVQLLDTFGNRPSLPSLPSLPFALARAGMSSAVFSGRDLARGLSGRYLRHVGVEHVSDADASVLEASAHDDVGATTRMMAYLDAARGGRPVFATLLLSGASAASAPDFASGAPAVRAVDAELGRVLAWYDANERARGTILVVTSLAASQAPAMQDPRRSELARARFEVPFAVVGEGVVALEEGTTARVGAIYDLPQTILGVLGQGPTGCFQGRNLLGADPWPSTRLVVGAAGPDQHLQYVHFGSNRWQLDVAATPPAWEVVDLENDPSLSRNRVLEMGVTHEDMESFYATYVAVSTYLLNRDRYVPPRPRAVVAALPDGESAVALSLEGSFTSLPSLPSRTYWVKLAYAEAEGFFVRGSDPHLPLDALLARARGARLVLELDEQGSASRGLALVAALGRAPRGASVAVASSDLHVLESVATRTTRDVYVISGGQEEATGRVTSARQLAAEGIVVAPAHATEALVAEGHAAGLRVMVLGAPRDFYLLHPGLRPDMLITADAEAARVLAAPPASAPP